MLLASFLTSLLVAAPSDTLLACDALAPDLASALSAHAGVVRWSTETNRPLVVWLQARPKSAARDVWQTALVDAVTAWNGVVPGLRLVVGADSADAQIRVTWAPTLATAPNDPSAGALASLTAGRTSLTWNGAGEAVTALVVLAATAPNGMPYQPQDVRAVARHEIGHALGLAHHASPASVMAPLVTADRVTPADRLVLRALYALPVGAGCRGER